VLEKREKVEGRGGGKEDGIEGGRRWTDFICLTIVDLPDSPAPSRSIYITSQRDIISLYDLRRSRRARQVRL
jgi:hypothetical protein